MPTDAELEAQAEALRSRNPQSSLHRLVDAIISRVEISVSPTGRALMRPLILNIGTGFAHSTVLNARALSWPWHMPTRSHSHRIRSRK